MAGPEDAAVDDVYDLVGRTPHHLLAQLGAVEVDDPDGEIALEVQLRPEIENSHGSLQGGLAATLADMAAGRAMVARLAGTGRRTATLDLHIRYLTVTRVGPVRVLANVVRLGGRVAVIDVDIVDVGQDRKLVATATLSFIVLDGPEGLPGRGATSRRTTG